MMNIGYNDEEKFVPSKKFIWIWYMVSYLVLQGSWKKMYFFLFICFYLFIFDNEALISVKPFSFTFIWTVWGETKTRASNMRNCKQQSATHLKVCF